MLRHLYCATTCFSVLRRLSDSTSSVLRSEVPITLFEKTFPFGFAKCFNVPDSRKNRAVIPLSPELYHNVFALSRVFSIIFYKKYNYFW